MILSRTMTALLALLLLVSSALADPPWMKGEWDVFFGGVYDDATAGQSGFGNAKGVLTIDAQQDSRFSGVLVYEGTTVELKFSGLMQGRKIRATVDGAVIEGTLTRTYKRTGRVIVFTSTVPRGANGVQAVYSGSATRRLQ